MVLAAGGHHAVDALLGVVGQLSVQNGAAGLLGLNDDLLGGGVQAVEPGLVGHEHVDLGVVVGLNDVLLHLVEVHGVGGLSGVLLSVNGAVGQSVVGIGVSHHDGLSAQGVVGIGEDVGLHNAHLQALHVGHAVDVAVGGHLTEAGEPHAQAVDAHVAQAAHELLADLVVHDLTDDAGVLGQQVGQVDHGGVLAVGGDDGAGAHGQLRHAHLHALDGLRDGADLAGGIVLHGDVAAGELQLRLDLKAGQILGGADGLGLGELNGHLGDLSGRRAGLGSLGLHRSRRVSAAAAAGGQRQSHRCSKDQRKYSLFHF